MSATVIFKEHYSDDYAFSYDCGGTTIEVTGHDDGVAHIRVGKGDFETAFFAHDNYSYTETHTNPDGDFLVITGNALFQETRATHVAGTVFTFSSVVSGQPFTVFDSNGKVLVRDRGSIRETILFDTLGDNMPGGTFIDSCRSTSPVPTTDLASTPARSSADTGRPAGLGYPPRSRACSSMAEQLTLNQRVEGSSPSRLTTPPKPRPRLRGYRMRFRGTLPPILLIGLVLAACQTPGGVD